MNFGRLKCVNVDSSTLTNIPLWWGRLIVGETMHVWKQEEYRKSLYFLLNLL